MKDVRVLRPVSDLINCEGTVVGLLRHPRGEWYLKAYVKEPVGYVYFPVAEDALKKYLNDEMTLDELYAAAPVQEVIFKYRTKQTVYPKAFFAEKLVAGDKYFTDYSANCRPRDAIF